ncbi:hypothetical protein BSL82_01200 [Tardibacter chloracetimidivorans]|uniref:Uncharacterized protein n=1 Tax=Tardibacter chloracetimidivorans TaxID=1921510 RepID=A0A1L3ZR26_9SPHN|nr:hypothetical protein [Tardibacter chloracetimidivorans]API58081.1 hypothetical protein BSL82_01200 [Tardibacter chloracetimidivorans]
MPRRGEYSWTQHEDTLRRMIGDSRPHAEIADAIGMSIGTVKSACRILGIRQDPIILKRNQAERARAIMADPELRARHRAAVNRKLEDPAYRAMLVDRITRARAKRDPQKIRERARALGTRPWTDEQWQNYLASRPEAGRKRTATVLDWCPPHLVNEYRHLVRVKRVPSAEARRIIEDQAASETPEKLLNRMFAAAEAPARPERRQSFSRVYTQTLGGVAA